MFAQDDQEKAILKFDIASSGFSMAVYSSNIGEFNPIVLQSTAEMVVNSFVLPEVNKAGQQGIQLPVPQIFTLIEPVSIIEDGYIFIGTDFQLNLGKLEQIHQSHTH